jgi:hypothetical protein
MEDITEKLKPYLQHIRGSEHLRLMRAGEPLECPVSTRVLTPSHLHNTIDLNVQTCGTICSQFIIKQITTEAGTKEIRVETCRACYNGVEVKEATKQTKLL